MLAAFDRFGGLPNDTKVFCGHEYTLKNLEFGIMAEGGDNPHLKEYYNIFSERLEKGHYTVPSLIAEERLYNVFIRCREPSIQKLVGSEDPIKCMAFLREFKNTGVQPAKM